MAAALSTFARLIDPGDLARIKRLHQRGRADAGERGTAARQPGSGLCLACQARAGHHQESVASHLPARRHLCRGDLELPEGRLAPQAWTYRDYASAPYLAVLTGVRRRYYAQLQDETIPQSG